MEPVDKYGVVYRVGQTPLVIARRDNGKCAYYSKTQEPLIEQLEADRQWIKDNLETTDIERALTLHKEIPKDPM